MHRWLLILVLANLAFTPNVNSNQALQEPGGLQTASGTISLYLPILQNNNLVSREAPSTGYRVNAPFFEQGVRTPETAIFWFGQVSSELNYVDMRVGYTPEEIYVHAAVIDRYLWYDPTAKLANFDQWDSISLYLFNEEKMYRFDGQISWWEQRQGFQAAYVYQDNTWLPVNIAFNTRSTWRGNALNDDAGDRGWMLTYYLPFSSLGSSAAPASGSVWKMGIVLNDRDSQAAPPLPQSTWPSQFKPANLGTWGELHFGLPQYSAPAGAPGETVVIRQGLNGVQTPDAAVGGSTTCGSGVDYWTEWGERTDPTAENINIQNQYDIADWPCFSRYYVAFPLDSVPPGKVILSAKLVMHQFGSSGGGEWGDPPPSWIQVLRVEGGWQEETLSWNSGPLALENLGGTWVEGLPVFPGWPGVRREWDVTQAIAQAYAAGEPVHLGLYSADGERHTGKYFVSSETPDWNAKARPRLEILWGNP